MKIALVTSTLQPGGAERQLCFLANNWAAAGEEVTLIVLGGSGSHVYFPLHPSVDVVFLDTAYDSRGLIDAVRAGFWRAGRLRAVLQQRGVEFVIAFLHEAAAVAAVAAGRLRLPLILSERNSFPDEPFPIRWRLVRWATFGRADAIVFQTERAMKAAPPRLRSKGSVIANFVEIPHRGGVSPEARRIVGVGRLVPQKGFDVLIRAFALVAAQLPDWRLTIWGDGPDRDQLAALIDSLGLRGRIDLPGASDKPGAWVQGASIFVLTSRYEGFPNVLCEAMANGLAVIATDCRFGPAEIVEPGVSGLLVPTDDPAATAAAIAALAEDAASRARMGEAGRLSMGRFSHDTLLHRWTLLARRLMRKEPVIE